MPLVEPGNEFYETYKSSQITGAYNTAFGFGIPLLYHEDLSVIKDLVNFGISYSHETLIQQIKSLLQTKDSITSLKEKIKNEPKFQFEFQRDRYMKFLNE